MPSNLKDSLAFAGFLFLVLSVFTFGGLLGEEEGERDACKKLSLQKEMEYERCIELVNKEK